MFVSKNWGPCVSNLPIMCKEYIYIFIKIRGSQDIKHFNSRKSIYYLPRFFFKAFWQQSSRRHSTNRWIITNITNPCHLEWGLGRYQLLIINAKFINPDEGSPRSRAMGAKDYKKKLGILTLSLLFMDWDQNELLKKLKI